MRNEISPHQTAIVLMDRQSADNSFVKDWLEKSPFLTNEINDIFQILEDISDFTVRTRPDVILVEVDSLKNDFLAIRQMMDCAAGDAQFPIFALSNSGKVVNNKQCFEGNLAEVRAQIEKMMPQSAALDA